MSLPCACLLPNERVALIAALRRDLQRERHKALLDAAMAPYHLQNIRMNVRLLEAFGYREHSHESFW